MRFAKLHGAGNDYVLIDARARGGDWPRLAQAICDRHYGVGADGLLLVLPSAVADLRMRIFNPDGSEAEMCGNGIRCFTKYAVEEGLLPSGQATIETLAGLRTVRPRLEGGKVVGVEVDMGAPQFEAGAIPFSPLEAVPEPIIDFPLEVAGRILQVSCLSMGNPHAVAFLEEPVAAFPLAELGPKVEHHPLFPKRVNFEVVNTLNRHQARARAWERGAGETLACGTGACAIAVAARLRGAAGTPLDVMLPGGTLTVHWDGAGEVVMTGPVALVFTGEWEG